MTNENGNNPVLLHATPPALCFFCVNGFKSDLLTVGVSFVVVVSRVKPPLTITFVLFALKCNFRNGIFKKKKEAQLLLLSPRLIKSVKELCITKRKKSSDTAERLDCFYLSTKTVIT